MLNAKDHMLIAQLKTQHADFSYILNKLEAEHHEILSGISHEIRNPLTLINSSLQLIESAHPEAKEFKFWNQIKEDIQYLRSLLDDLSMFNNSDRLQRELLDLNTLAHAAAASFTPEFSCRHMQLKVFPCENLPLVSGDSIKLKELLFNLLKNAIEAMTAGGTAGIYLDFDKNFVYLSVKDTGCGIPAAYRNEIFLPFKTFKSQGTGLGLPLSEQIAAAHGGSLTFETEDGKGTVFTLSLPAYF